jgi:hypothetical protein
MIKPITKDSQMLFFIFSLLLGFFSLFQGGIGWLDQPNDPVSVPMMSTG